MTSEISLITIMDNINIPVDIIMIIKDYAIRDIKFLEIIEKIKQNNTPIKFYHFTDECTNEKSKIYVHVNCNSIQLQREGIIKTYNHINSALINKKINDSMDITILNIDIIINIANNVKEMVHAFAVSGPPECYMPSGIEYAIFDLMERIGQMNALC